MICEKCGEDKKLIRHHICYIEIEGFEEIEMICRSCHKFLHQKLRKEGKCDISPFLLQKYTTRSACKTEEYKTKKKVYDKEYRNNNKEHLDELNKIRRFNSIEHKHDYDKEYRDKNKQNIKLHKSRERQANKIYGDN